MSATVHLTGRAIPNADAGTRYEALYASYRTLYTALQLTFAALSSACSFGTVHRDSRLRNPPLN
jgi:hypothetical protein